MVRYTYDRINEELRDFGGQVANGAINATCQIWRKYARNYVGENAGLAPIRWFFNGMCPDPYQPPPPPFTGGQCAFPYNVKTTATYRYRSEPSAVGIVVTVEYRFPPIKGPFSADENILLPAGTRFGGLVGRPPRAYVRGELDNGWSLISPIDFTQWTQPSNIVLDHRISSVIPTSGQPDNCGDLPSEYPPPPPLPPGGESITVNIVDIDNNVIPLVFVYNDVDFNVPIQFDLSGARVYVDIGGVDIRWEGDFNFNFNGEPAGKNPFPEAPPEAPGGGSGREFPQPGDDGVEEKPPVEVDDEESIEEEEEEDEQILWVEMFMIEQPRPRHRILYTDPTLNVHYGGYLSWISNKVDNSPEMPIRRSRTLVPKPEEYTGYRFRAINGAKYQVKVYLQKKVKPKQGEG